MGIFSGLSGAFLAGATERVSANWKESREKMEAKINKKTQLFYDDAKTARDARRAEKKAVKQQFEDALAVLGNDPNAGAVAEAMARLTPEQFAETKATLMKVRAEASSKGMGTDLRSLGVISDTPEIEKVAFADPATGIVPDTISKFTGSSDDAVKRIMGTFEGTKVGVDPKENKTLQQGFLKHVGGLSTAGITSEAEREAAEQLGVTPERLRALRGEGDAFTSGVAPKMAGVSLGATDPTIRRGFEAEDRTAAAAAQQLELLTVQIDNARITNEDLKVSNKPYTMTYGGEEFEGSAKQHAARLDAITKKQNFDIAEQARRLGKPLAIGEINTFNKALSTFTGVLGDNTLIFNAASNMYVPSRDTKDAGLLALVIGNAYRAQEQAGLRMQPNQSILDVTAQYLEPSKPAGDILTSIREAEGADGYVQGSTTTTSPYLNALNRATETVRAGMLKKIERLAGVTGGAEDTADSAADAAWASATENSTNRTQQVQNLILELGIPTRTSNASEYEQLVARVVGALGASSEPITGTIVQRTITEQIAATD
jgi:hypothetical protein